MVVDRVFCSTVTNSILAPDYESTAYVEQYLNVHMRRFCETVGIVRDIAHPSMRVVDIGSYGSLVPPLQDVLGLTDITITAPGDKGKPATESATLANARNGGRYAFRLDRFDLEGPFPYPDGAFDFVIFTEVLEHIARDPMLTLSEINRITKPRGWIVVSTPNCASAKSILKILRGGNPNVYPVYTKQPSNDRHNREYAPWEVRELLHCCGYDVVLFRTTDVYVNEMAAWLSSAIKATLAIGSLLTLNRIKVSGRGDTIFAVGQKISGVKERYPSFLYT